MLRNTINVALLANSQLLHVLLYEHIADILFAIRRNGAKTPPPLIAESLHVNMFNTVKRDTEKLFLCVNMPT
jgi:hypothetical protein